MNTRRCLLGGSALAVVLATLGASAPALAAPAPTTAPTVAPHQASAQGAVALTDLRLVQLDGDTATLQLTGSAHAHAVITDLTTSRELVVEMTSVRTRVEVPVAHGSTTRFRASVTDGDVASAPLETTVTNTVSSLAAPVVTKVTTVGRGRIALEVDGANGAELIVKDARGSVIGHTDIDGGSGPSLVGAEWNTQDPPSERRFTVVQRFGVTSPATPFRLPETAPTPPVFIQAPAIESMTVVGGRAHIAVVAHDAPADAVVKIRDFYGKEVAAAKVHEGRATLTLAEPEFVESYSVSIAGTLDAHESESLGAPVIIGGGGPLVPAPPVVDDVAKAGSRSVATVAGTPGATITVRDASDRVVAVKRLASTSSTAQILLPSSSDLTATQATGAIESDPARIDASIG